MKTEIIVAIIGIIGISLGAVFASWGYFFKLRAERKKNAKSVLYYLLEIRYTLQTNFTNPENNTKEYINYYKKYLSKKNINIEESEVPDQLFEIMKTIFSQVNAVLQTKLNQDFIVPFENALLELSKDDPILAYKLKGKEKLTQLVQVQEDYSNEVKEYISTTVEKKLYENILVDQLSINNQEVTDELLKDLAYDIRQVSWKCGFFVYLKSVVLLKKQLINTTSNFSKMEIDKNLDRLILALDEANKEEAVQMNSAN